MIYDRIFFRYLTLLNCKQNNNNNSSFSSKNDLMMRTWDGPTSGFSLEITVDFPVKEEWRALW
jgi:hypothetical protein